MALSWTPTGEYNEDLFRQYTEMIESDSSAMASDWFRQRDAVGQEALYWEHFENPVAKGAFEYESMSNTFGYSFTKPVVNSLITQGIATNTAPVTIETPVLESTGLLSGADYGYEQPATAPVSAPIQEPVQSIEPNSYINTVQQGMLSPVNWAAPQQQMINQGAIVGYEGGLMSAATSYNPYDTTPSSVYDPNIAAKEAGENQGWGRPDNWTDTSYQPIFDDGSFVYDYPVDEPIVDETPVDDVVTDPIDVVDPVDGGDTEEAIDVNAGELEYNADGNPVFLPGQEYGYTTINGVQVGVLNPDVVITNPYVDTNAVYSYGGDVGAFVDTTTGDIDWSQTAESGQEAAYGTLTMPDGTLIGVENPNVDLVRYKTFLEELGVVYDSLDTAILGSFLDDETMSWLSDILPDEFVNSFTTYQDVVDNLVKPGIVAASTGLPGIPFTANGLAGTIPLGVFVSLGDVMDVSRGINPYGRDSSILGGILEKVVNIFDPEWEIDKTFDNYVGNYDITGEAIGAAEGYDYDSMDAAEEAGFASEYFTRYLNDTANPNVASDNNVGSIDALKVDILNANDLYDTDFFYDPDTGTVREYTFDERTEIDTIAAQIEAENAAMEAQALEDARIDAENLITAKDAGYETYDAYTTAGETLNSFNATNSTELSLLDYQILETNASLDSVGDIPTTEEILSTYEAQQQEIVDTNVATSYEFNSLDAAKSYAEDWGVSVEELYQIIDDAPYSEAIGDTLAYYKDTDGGRVYSTPQEVDIYTAYQTQTSKADYDQSVIDEAAKVEADRLAAELEAAAVLEAEAAAAALEAAEKLDFEQLEEATLHNYDTWDNYQLGLLATDSFNEENPAAAYNIDQYTQLAIDATDREVDIQVEFDNRTHLANITDESTWDAATISVVGYTEDEIWDSLSLATQNDITAQQSGHDDYADQVSDTTEISDVVDLTTLTAALSNTPFTKDEIYLGLTDEIKSDIAAQEEGYDNSLDKLDYEADTLIIDAISTSQEITDALTTTGLTRAEIEERMTSQQLTDVATADSAADAGYTDVSTYVTDLQEQKDYNDTTAATDDNLTLSEYTIARENSEMYGEDIPTYLATEAELLSVFDVDSLNDSADILGVTPESILESGRLNDDQVSKIANDQTAIDLEAEAAIEEARLVEEARLEQLDTDAVALGHDNYADQLSDERTISEILDLEDFENAVTSTGLEEQDIINSLTSDILDNINSELLDNHAVAEGHDDYADLLSDWEIIDAIDSLEGLRDSVETTGLTMQGVMDKLTSDTQTVIMDEQSVENGFDNYEQETIFDTYKDSFNNYDTESSLTRSETFDQIQEETNMEQDQLWDKLDVNAQLAMTLDVNSNVSDLHDNKDLYDVLSLESLGINHSESVVDLHSHPDVLAAELEDKTGYGTVAELNSGLHEYATVLVDDQTKNLSKLGDKIYVGNGKGTIYAEEWALDYASALNALGANAGVGDIVSDNGNWIEKSVIKIIDNANLDYASGWGGHCTNAACEVAVTLQGAFNVWDSNYFTDILSEFYGYSDFNKVNKSVLTNYISAYESKKSLDEFAAEYMPEMVTGFIRNVDEINTNGSARFDNAGDYANYVTGIEDMDSDIMPTSSDIQFALDSSSDKGTTAMSSPFYTGVLSYVETDVDTGEVTYHAGIDGWTNSFGEQVLPVTFDADGNLGSYVLDNTLWVTPEGDWNDPAGNGSFEPTEDNISSDLSTDLASDDFFAEGNLGAIISDWWDDATYTAPPAPAPAPAPTPTFVSSSSSNNESDNDAESETTSYSSYDSPSDSTGPSVSDVSLKTNIVKIGELASGLGLYSWEWNDIAKSLGVKSRTEGVLAQEVLEVNPDAVSVGENGYYQVDYNRIK